MAIKNTIWGYENRRRHSLLPTFHRTRQLARDNKKRLGITGKFYKIVSMDSDYGFEVA